MCGDSQSDLLTKLQVHLMGDAAQVSWQPPDSEVSEYDFKASPWRGG